MSFKKGNWLAIRGQLSADWWQGSLLNQSKDTAGQQRVNKYIPDKYIALRSANRKFSSNSTQSSLIQSMTTPSSVNNLSLTSERMSASMNQKSLLTTPPVGNNKNYNKMTGKL